MRLGILLVGIFLFIISFFVGIGAMYYESPKLMVDESFSLKHEVLRSFNLSPPPASSLRYDISCQSAGPLAVMLSFLDERGSVLSSVELSGNRSIRSENRENFVNGPSEVALKLSLANEASCHLRIYYSSFDEGALLLMVAIQLLTSLLAISLIVSSYLEFRRKAPKTRGESQSY